MPPLQYDGFNRLNTISPVISNRSFGNRTTKRNNKSMRGKNKWRSQHSEPLLRIGQGSTRARNKHDFADPAKTSRKWSEAKRSAVLSDIDQPTLNDRTLNSGFVEDPVIDFGCAGCSFSFYKFRDDFTYTKDEILVKEIYEPLRDDLLKGAFGTLLGMKENKSQRRRETKTRWTWS